MRAWIRKHSLSLILLTIMLIMMTATVLLGQAMFSFEAGHANAVGFWHWWVFLTLVSLEADVFGAIVLVLFTKWFHEVRSAEAKDPPN